MRSSSPAKARGLATAATMRLADAKAHLRAAAEIQREAGDAADPRPVQPPPGVPRMPADKACLHRADAPAVQIPGEVFDCNCTGVRLFHCGHFGELVSVGKVKASWRAVVLDWNRETKSRYKGRTCRRCESWTPRGPRSGECGQGGQAEMEVTVSRGGKRQSITVGETPIAVGNQSAYRNVNADKPLPASGLISPADHKIVQIEITNRCFLDCSNCTRLVGHQEHPYEMTRGVFSLAVESVADHPGMIGIMGGEPTLHRDFDWLVRHYASVIDPGRKYQLLRKPILDLAAYRQDNCASLHHRRGLWSAIGPKFLRHLELITEVFGYWCLNDHSHAGKHQGLLMARRDLGVGDDRWRVLRDQCWIQRTWSSSISPAGAYFCEVAAAIDATLFSGKHAWPIEPGWWKRTPADFGGQLSLCEYCAAPLDVPARLPAENRDDVTPTLVPLLTAAGSPRVAAGRVVVHGTETGGRRSEVGGQIASSGFGVETYMAQPHGAVDNAVRVAPNNRWLRPREIVGCMVCVDFSDWLPDLLEANSKHFDRLVVVTTPDDTRTQSIARAAGVDVVVTDACYADGDAFNKGKMLNAGLECLQPRDWVLFHDADVLLAPDWGEWLRSRVLNPGVLYHARRVHALSDADWTAAMTDWPTSGRLRIREAIADLKPFGFHQLWNVRAGSIAGRDPIVSEVFPSAATVDYHFYRLWPEDKRDLLPNALSIVHRWHGAFTSRWHNRGVAAGGWEWIGQVSPAGALWILPGKEPLWPASLRLIDLDTELAEIVPCRSREELESNIGRRVIDVYASREPRA